MTKRIISGTALGFCVVFAVILSSSVLRKPEKIVVTSVPGEPEISFEAPEIKLNDAQTLAAIRIISKFEASFGSVTVRIGQGKAESVQVSVTPLKSSSKMPMYENFIIDRAGQIIDDTIELPA